MIRLDENLVSIMHYRKILKVGTSEIHVEMNRKIIMISGEDLYLYLLNKDEIILKGKIMKVDFHERI